RKFLVLLVMTAAGCQACPCEGPVNVEGSILAVAAARVVPEPVPPAAFLSCGTGGTPVDPHGPLALPTLWDLALANNPSLREPAADVGAARGRLLQAGLYPNPRFLYEEGTIGSRAAPQGNFVLQLNQEIVTAGKRRLDRAVASRETDVASLALLGRKF